MEAVFETAVDTTAIGTVEADEIIEITVEAIVVVDVDVYVVVCAIVRRKGIVEGISTAVIGGTWLRNITRNRGSATTAVVRGTTAAIR